MKTKITFAGVVLILAFFGICFMFAGRVFADLSQFEMLTNHTNRPANDLEKYLEGDITVSEWCSGPYPFGFTIFDYIHVSTDPDTTILIWSGNTVEPNHCVVVTYTPTTDEIHYLALPKWSFGKSDTIAGPALSAKVNELPKAGRIAVDLGNEASEKVSMTADTIQVACVKNLFTCHQLCWDSLELLVDDWTVTKTNVHFPPDRWENIFTGLKPPSGGGIVYRVKLYLDSDPSNIVRCGGQYGALRQTPTFTQWGLIILVALLVVSTVFVILRRRRGIVPA